MSSHDKQQISERELVRKAAVDPHARQQLKEVLLPYVGKATKELMQKWNILDSREQELIEVGMAPFDKVFNIYLKNAAEHNEFEGYFYKYYMWWMRKAISEYLHTKSSH